MPQGILNAFSAHRRILVLLEALIFSAENCTQCMGSWARLKGPILMPLACIVAHFFLSEDTAFLMEVLYRGNFVHLEASAASWFISPH